MPPTIPSVFTAVAAEASAAAAETGHLRLGRDVAERSPLPARQNPPEHALRLRAPTVVEMPVADAVCAGRIRHRHLACRPYAQHRIDRQLALVQQHQAMIGLVL